eukprot:6070690-Amphidinium_carterae.1
MEASKMDKRLVKSEGPRWKSSLAIFTLWKAQASDIRKRISSITFRAHRSFTCITGLRSLVTFTPLQRVGQNA